MDGRYGVHLNAGKAVFEGEVVGTAEMAVEKEF